MDTTPYLFFNWCGVLFKKDVFFKLKDYQLYIKFYISLPCLKTQTELKKKKTAIQHLL